jgi:hypothetical protein
MTITREVSASKYEILKFAVPANTADYNVKVQQSAFVNLDDAPLAKFVKVSVDLAATTLKFNSTTDDPTEALTPGIDYKRTGWTSNLFITNPSLTTAANYVIYLD